MMLQKGNKFKKGKRKRSTCEDEESNKKINCIKTYRKTLNNKISKLQSYYSDGIKDLPGNQTKQWSKQLMQYIKTSLSNSKFVLVPFFSVLEKDVKIGLQLSAFAKMFTYLILPWHCPMSMVAMKDTNKQYQ
jgi:hypothetical protein